jgi:hypothetical protein
MGLNFRFLSIIFLLSLIILPGCGGVKEEVVLITSGHLEFKKLLYS